MIGTNTPRSSSDKRISAIIFLTLFLPILGAVSPAGAITRQDAIDLVTTDIIDTLSVNYALNGFAMQVTIPGGTFIAQNTIDTLTTTVSSSWFIWLDLNPRAQFGHPTKFVLVDDASGTIAWTADGQWWPSVGGVELYATNVDRDLTADAFLTSFGSGGAIPGTEDGRFRFPRIEIPDDIKRQNIVPKTEAADVWGIIITPYDTAADKEFGADIRCAIESFESLGVTPDVQVGKTKAEILSAIDALPQGCDKLYVFWTGHGTPDTLWLPGGKFITAKEFACKLKDQAADEYCVIVEACHSGSLLDELAEKKVNGFHSMSSDGANSSCYFLQSDGDAVDGSIFPLALWDCIQQGLTGIEAFEWADSAVTAITEALKNGPDSTNWRKWLNDCKNNNTTGGYVHTFDDAKGEPFCFQIGEACSTVCLRFPGGASSDTCGNFTLQCEVSSGTGTSWVNSSTYNWNLGKSIYFRRNGTANATGKYKVVMHSNKPGVRMLATWLRDTSEPVTPTPFGSRYNNHSIGWLDASAAEFNDTLGQGTFGFYNYGWFPGTLTDEVPATTGPNWFQQFQVELPMEIDPDRPWLYNSGDPLQGFADSTVLILGAADLVDPFGGIPAGFTEVFVSIWQPSMGGGSIQFSTTIGPDDFLGGTQKAAAPSQSIVNLGTIFPEPLFLTIDVFGPDAIEWDAIVMMPGEALVVPTSVDPSTAPQLPDTRLHPATPNPFNPTTRIRFDLDRSERVNVSVYTLGGRLVRTLLDERRDAGVHEVTWDGRTAAGDPVGSGVYLYRMEADSGVESRKMILVR